MLIISDQSTFEPANKQEQQATYTRLLSLRYRDEHESRPRRRISSRFSAILSFEKRDPLPRMSPATNGKSASPSSGVKRRADSAAGSAKKRAKRGTTSKSKGSKTNGLAPEDAVSKPEGWDNMNLYKSFLLSNERFELHDTIFVNSREQPEDSTKEEEDAAAKTIDETDNTLWVAAVVEVRAQNAWNVWVRIEWFYRPEELPGGRQPYHGKKEVIKSPVQDIISAHTVAGHADVTHWEEMDDSKDADGIDGLFWRQTFDPFTSKLSEPRLHCVCKKPYNPDTTMFWCDKCKIWEHEKCLSDAIRRNYLKSAPSNKKSRKSLGKNIFITIATNEVTGEVTAHIDDKDRKARTESDDESEQKEPDQDSVKTSVLVKCLKCGAQLK